MRYERDGIEERGGVTCLNLEDFDWNENTSTGLIPPSMDIDQQATLIFSSGSTGIPKAILHSYGNHYFSAVGSNQNIMLSHKDRWLLSLPLYHVAGISILFRVFVGGASVVIPGDRSPIGENLELFEVTHVSVVSTQLQQLVQANKSYHMVKAVLVGGSAVSETLRSQALNTGIPIFFSYGSSEMSSQVTTTSPKASMNEILTSGHLLPYRLLRISADNEIQVKGETLFLGYVVGNEIDLPVDDEGWFATGDLGAIDEQGLLTVLGRKDNMFISGGENIYPEHVEKVILSHPRIRNALVVPVRDQTFGVRPAAFIEADEFAVVKAELEIYLNGKLARYMHPVAYFDWKDSPERVGIKDSVRNFPDEPNNC